MPALVLIDQHRDTALATAGRHGVEDDRFVPA
jgi:hypothetical protein